MRGVTNIALDKQIHLYAVDTRAFYTDEEMEIDVQLNELRKEQKKWKAVSRCLEKYYSGETSSSNTKRRLIKLGILIEPQEEIPPCEKIPEYRQKSRELAPAIKTKKEELKDLLDKSDARRSLRTEFINDYNIISLFDSELTRTCELIPDVLTKDLIIVKTCYFKILKDLIDHGFHYNGNTYVCYTASAGQIRTKRTVFINSGLLGRYSSTLMCGLTTGRINQSGGVNINKFLAYLALTNSATDRWTGFDVDKCIVVDDMETVVHGVVDYIDEKTYDITRQEMGIPITHTDGCGVMLPSVSKKNFMVRLPWVKGLLGAFPFDKFIREANRRNPKVNHGIVKDIYGQEHDVLSEGIEVIFTRSQFKMWKFYSDWSDYKNNFKKYNCHAGICNVEPGTFDKAKINYQMLQTLTDLSDDELRHMSRFTIDRLHKISHDRETMLKVFGATNGNTRKNAFQKCLQIYPELLQDEYCRDTLRQIKKSIEKEAVSGRLDVNGTYSFILPDLYAFCQWLFMGDKNPTGLLGDGEVYCRLFPAEKDIACLRSPHLYREWAIRRNMVGTDSEYKRWFVTDGLYTSCHDLISKILQFDNDGDKSLIIDDDILISAAKRHMEGIVPLYYEMKKAPAQQITSENIYGSLIAAYTGGNIGEISNAITKIWNSGNTKDLSPIKWLCMENNFCIDYAKTLYKPVRPDSVGNNIKNRIHGKVPKFFVEAKNKQEHQVEPINMSCVNRLRTIIPMSRLNFSARQLGIFDWRVLTSSEIIPQNDISQKIIDIYKDISSSMPFSFNKKNDDTNVYYLCQKLRDKLLEIHPDEDYIVDVLVKQLFYKTKTKNKNVFWQTYGDIVLKNLTQNVDIKLDLCCRCGVRFKKESPRHVMCNKCSEKQRRKLEAQRLKKLRKRTHFENSLQLNGAQRV